MRIHNYLMIVLLGIVNVCFSDRVVQVRSAGEFYARLRPRLEHQLVLAAVLFFDSDQFSEKALRDQPRDERKAARAQHMHFKKLIKRQRDAFAHAGKAVGEVAFLAIDVSRPANVEIAQMYQLTTYPTILLFKDGKLLINKNQKPVALAENFNNNHVLDVNEIVQFVQRYFNKDIAKIVKAKARIEFELAKARAAAPKVYGGPYWGWGWGYPYGYGWGYWGGCGWGRCW